jgi:hypothetical protein
MHIAIEEINAAKAKQYLTLNLRNRTLRQHRVNRYAEQMTRGQWKETGDPIRFSVTGQLLDGQHRLAAIIAADVTLKAIVIRDVSDDVFPVLDSGLSRTPADTLGSGHEKSASHKAAAIRQLLVVELGGDPRKSDDLQTITRIDISEYYGNHVEEVSAAVHTASRMYEAFAGGNRSAWGAFIIMAYRIHPELAEEFIEGVRLGTNLEIGDPRLALRNWLANKRALPNAGAHLGLLIKTWNAWIKGNARLTMMLRDTEEFPTMVGVNK